MKALRHIKIVIIEDDDFYNKLLTKYLEKKLQEFSLKNKIVINIISYSNYNEFLKNFDTETTIIFTDYYLNNNNNALQIIEFVKATSSKCKVVVVSQTHNIQSDNEMLDAYAFVNKDTNALNMCKHYAETIISEKLNLK